MRNLDDFIMLLLVLLFMSYSSAFNPNLCTVLLKKNNKFSNVRRLEMRTSVNQDSLTEYDPFAQYESLKFAIFGGGAFSLAMAKVLSYKNISSSMLVRSPDVADYINTNHFHPKYLVNNSLPIQLWASANIEEVLENVTHIIHAVPMQQSREFLTRNEKYIPSNIPLLSVTKGVEQVTFSLMSDIVVETLGSYRRAAYLSGPSFAKEIMNGQATAVVIASTDDALANELSDILSSVEFRCHTSRDVKGVELGGAMKNVIALAAGMCEGLGLGMNAMSSLITRGCTEMSRMGVLFGADQETFGGLAGVGDTFGTCLGPLSRNRQVGLRLARGEKLDEILVNLDGVSEGIYTALALEQLIKTKVRPTVFEMKFPIISGVASIIKGNITPEFGLRLLMQYPLRDENPY